MSACPAASAATPRWRAPRSSPPSTRSGPRRTPPAAPWPSPSAASTPTRRSTRSPSSPATSPSRSTCAPTTPTHLAALERRFHDILAATAARRGVTIDLGPRNAAPVGPCDAALQAALAAAAARAGIATLPLGSPASHDAANFAAARHPDRPAADPQRATAATTRTRRWTPPTSWPPPRPSRNSCARPPEPQRAKAARGTAPIVMGVGAPE